MNEQKFKFPKKIHSLLFNLTLMLDIYHDFIELKRGNTNDRLLLAFYSLFSMSKIILDELTPKELQDWENLLSYLGILEYYKPSRYNLYEPFEIPLVINIPIIDYDELIQRYPDVDMKELFLIYMFHKKQLLLCENNTCKKVLPNFYQEFKNSIEIIETTEKQIGYITRQDPKIKKIMELHIILKIDIFDIPKMFNHIYSNKTWLYTLLNYMKETFNINFNIQSKNNFCDLNSNLYNLPVSNLLQICKQEKERKEQQRKKSEMTKRSRENSPTIYDKSYCRNSQIFDAQSICQNVNINQRKELCQMNKYEIIDYNDNSILDISFLEKPIKTNILHIDAIIQFQNMIYMVPQQFSAKMIAEKTNFALAKTIGDLSQVLNAFSCGETYVSDDIWSIYTAIALFPSINKPCKIYLPNQELFIQKNF